jgi:hypothetical protein
MERVYASPKIGKYRSKQLNLFICITLRDIKRLLGGESSIGHVVL